MTEPSPESHIPHLASPCHCLFKRFLDTAEMKTLSQSLALVAALFTPAQAGLRFPCSTLTTQRLDPAAQPGSLPSAHLHMIVGGNAFNATMWVFFLQSFFLFEEERKIVGYEYFCC